MIEDTVEETTLIGGVGHTTTMTAVTDMRMSFATMMITIVVQGSARGLGAALHSGKSGIRGDIPMRRIMTAVCLILIEPARAIKGRLQNSQ